MENKTEHLLIKKMMAKSLGISVQAFDNWNVSPEFRQGRSTFYSVRSVLDNRINHVSNKLEEKQQRDPSTLDIDEERARLVAAQADKTELEVKLLKRESVKIEEVTHEWAEMIGNCRAKLLSIPTKIAPKLLGIDDISEAQQILKDAIFEALTELSDDVYTQDQEGT
ncbi:hypothetical protein JK628_02955 [Shewanella sp. KX20019]|uniref:hypothetical protein n=1 Tax=Shewanella sp. KX20019 TaxID=2803864 RepID=UPI0019290258|nr:hypothetical protein [Shewanella sp. KX20019]QQX80849.1 hypothetical protein JK628_02955 [Shewanella sp. KX20019]